MKKFIIFVFCSLLAVGVSAQEIVSIVRCDCPYGGSKIYLSNGDKLLGASRYGWKLLYPERRNITTNFKCGFKYSLGTLVYKAGELYSVVDLQKIGTYTIRRVTTHNVQSEQVASLIGDYTYRGFLVYAEADGKIKGTSSGGTKTIVNVYFTNGKYATVEASKDPIWLDACEGMQVEHYQWRDFNVYKIL